MGFLPNEENYNSVNRHCELWVDISSLNDATEFLSVKYPWVLVVPVWDRTLSDSHKVSPKHTQAGPPRDRAGVCAPGRAGLSCINHPWSLASPAGRGEPLKLSV